METTLDTVSFNHLVRLPKKKRGLKAQINIYKTSLDEPIKRGKLKILIDDGGALVDEWQKTCGHEIVSVVLSHWEPYGGIVQIKNLPRLDQGVAQKLRQLGFNDTIDKLVLKIGIATADKVVVSEDGDFWDPKNPKRRGDSSAPVASLCFNSLGVTIMLLRALVKILR